MITKDQVVTSLREMGLKEGDIVLLHSALSSIGRVDGGAETVVAAFIEILGNAGTLVVPISGAMGIITEVVKNNPNSVKSIHPKASVAAIGSHAKEICKDHWKAETSHGENTPYTRIAKMGGYVCLLGVDQDRNTSLHTAEALLRLPYLVRTEEVTFDTPEGEITKSWLYFPGQHRNFIGLDRAFRESGGMRVGRVGSSVVRLIRAQDMIDICMKLRKKDPAFALCNNPNCADCLHRRAVIRRDSLSKESFRFSVSASLAGRYVPEIVENLKKEGIHIIELDELEGRPLIMWNSEKISNAVNEFRQAGIEISALRSSVVSQRYEEFVQTAVDCDAKRIILPLSFRAESMARTANQKHIRISFFNNNFGSEDVSDILMELKKKGLTAGFVFSGAHFARLGEKPFLDTHIYKKRKLKKYIDQLDVEDGTFDGTPAPLGKGNAEVHEMVSILRCSSFNGYMTLPSSNRFVGNLTDAVRSFENLLKDI